MNKNPATKSEATIYLQTQIRRARKVRELRREMEIECAEIKERLIGLRIEEAYLIRHNNDMRARMMSDSIDALRGTPTTKGATFLDEIRLVARACDASSIAAMERMGMTAKGGMA